MSAAKPDGVYPKAGEGLIDKCPKCGGLIIFDDAEIDGIEVYQNYRCDCGVIVKFKYVPVSWYVIRGYEWCRGGADERRLVLKTHLGCL